VARKSRGDYKGEVMRIEQNRVVAVEEKIFKGELDEKESS
jgi:hypothetical protein